MLCGALALALAPNAQASTFLRVSGEELAAKAEAVVQGRVLEVSSFWNREGTVILTEATLEVEDTVLGQDRSHLRLVTFGGQVGDMVIEAHGFPTFKKGQRLLLFLDKARASEDGAHRILGYRQGEFEIRIDKLGREIAVPTWEGNDVRILKADGTEASVPLPVLLDEFKDQIRANAQRAGRTSAKPQAH
jgi:hypothetical protein